MKENEHVAEIRDWTRDLQIFNLTLSQLSYFGWFVVNVQAENYYYYYLNLFKNGNPSA